MVHGSHCGVHDHAHAKKENITLIFERSAVVALDEAVDITSTIIQLYDAGK